ncbi:MAG TPA: ABC transporter permease [Solirubrobacteraceae bacterium]|nr:ABC transporter permease [Solirubrobacteraceae bacterium]
MTSLEARAGPSVRIVFTSLFRADFLVFLKHRRALVVSLLLPIFLLLSTNASKATHSFGGAEFIIGLAIAYGLAATSIVGYALTVARDREKGVFQRLRVTPAPTWTIMTSRLAMQAVANLILALVVVIIGTRLHHLSPSIGQYLLVLLVALLGGAVFLSIAQAMVGLVRSADTVQAIARVLLAVLILLGTLGQSGALGNFWQDVARWSPVGVVMTLFAGVLNLHAWDSRDTISLAVSCVYIVVCAGIGIRWFQWEAR